MCAVLDIPGQLNGLTSDLQVRLCAGNEVADSKVCHYLFVIVITSDLGRGGGGSLRLNIACQRSIAAQVIQVLIQMQVIDPMVKAILL